MPKPKTERCGVMIVWGDSHCELAKGHDGAHSAMQLRSSDYLDGDEVRATLREWARQIRAAETKEELSMIADDLDVNAGLQR